MLRLLRLLCALPIRLLRSRRDLFLENLALRQQLTALKPRHPQPRLAAPDRLFWIVLRQCWSGWKRTLLIVQPETVVRCHRAGFRLYWKWISRRQVRRGRTPTTKELRELIFRMVVENPTWGAPRIHGELKILGFEISERTVLRWMRKAPQNSEPTRRWEAFLSNHREAIAAMDFFTVPTLTFGVLYCFFVIAHDQRRTYSSRGTPTFINLDRPYPHQVFTALVWGEDRATVGSTPESGRLCVTGNITAYHGVPEIVVRDAKSWYVPK